MLNGLGYQRSLAAHREQIEADIARHRDKIARDRAEAVAQVERYEFEKRTFMEAEHAKNVAAEARMRAAQGRSIGFWQGFAVVVFLLAFIMAGQIGVAELIATFLGN
jgi:hypothetical protein